MKPTPAASFVLRRGAGPALEILTVKRPPDDEDLPDLWGLPAASLRPAESWWEAVRRAGREKLGIELAGIRLRAEGRAERAAYTLHMRLFEAEVAAGRPLVTGGEGPRGGAPRRRGAPGDGVTRYADCGWAPPARLQEAAAKGSLCSRLCLQWLRGARAGCGVGPASADPEPPGRGVARPGGDAARLEGVVVRGHGVASGGGPRPFLPGGTIRSQLPSFRERGLDLAGFHPGTVNVSLSPARLAWEHPRVTFRRVKWHPRLPAETFSFSPCRLRVEGPGRPGWLYRPHPETKPRHRQPDDVVEVITERLDGVVPGVRVALEVDPSEVRVERRAAP